MRKPVAPSVPVLVTGASSGIGECFARAFARRGHEVTAVARRPDRLEALASDVAGDGRGRVIPLVADLGTTEGRARTAGRLAGGGPWILVNNAGFGSWGRFAELDPRRESAQVTLNVLAVAELTAAVLPANIAAARGGVINVASVAAFQPIPYMATYAATKAFVLSLTEALAGELAGTGVRMMALCPGPVRTEFGEVAGIGAMISGSLPMSARRCVDIGLHAFDRGRHVCLPGLRNLVMVQWPRPLPRAVVRRVVGTLFSPP